MSADFAGFITRRNIRLPIHAYAKNRANSQCMQHSRRHSGSKCLYCSDFGRVWLSFQSTLHLSLTVLVHYRTREDIELQMVYTIQLALLSQTTRLWENGPYAAMIITWWTGFSPFVMLFSNRPSRMSWLVTLQDITIQSSSQSSGFRYKLFPLHSPLLRKSLVVFFTSAYLYA